MYTPRFLFVKEPSMATSTSQDKKHHKTLIQRHAQIQAIVSRRQKFISLDTGTGRFETPSTASGCENSQGVSPSLYSKQTPRSSNPATGGCGNKSASTCEVARKNLVRSRYVSPTDQKHGGTSISSKPINPFSIAERSNAFPIDLDDQVCQYLQYYLSVAHEQLLCSMGLVKSSRKDSLLESASIMIQSCFKNELLMYTLLANISTMLPELDVASTFPSSAYYCYQAIKAVRRYLSTTDRLDESVILGLWHLISAENTRGDSEAALTHLRGAHAILRHLRQSGCPPSPQYVALLEACDPFWAIGVHTRQPSSSPSAKEHDKE